jgi:PleD family two-component response regulator
MSIGLALYRSRKETFEACLARADDALYAAKRAGRNRVVSAETS